MGQRLHVLGSVHHQPGEALLLQHVLNSLLCSLYAEVSVLCQLCVMGIICLIGTPEWCCSSCLADR